LYEYLEQNSKNIEKGFYCYVVSQIGRDNLQGYMDGFRDMLKQSITKKEEDKLPDVIKKDDVTMDFRKKEIERTADRLSNSVVSDLFSMLDMKN
jgi:type I restriction-modification system DNA methylase subunit